MIRPPLPSTGFPGTGSPASAVLPEAPTPERPPHRVSYSFTWRSSAPVSHRLDDAESRSGLLGSWGTPMHARPALRPRWECGIRPLRCRTVAGSSCRDTAPTRLLLSGLHHTAHGLAVYASQGGLSLHHARLASGRWPGITGRGWLPAGSQLKVSITSSCVPPSPSCPAHARLSRGARVSDLHRRSVQLGSEIVHLRDARHRLVSLISQPRQLIPLGLWPNRELCGQSALMDVRDFIPDGSCAAGGSDSYRERPSSRPMRARLRTE
jgi:hypothetical protein